MTGVIRSRYPPRPFLPTGGGQLPRTVSRVDEQTSARDLVTSRLTVQSPKKLSIKERTMSGMGCRPAGVGDRFGHAGSSGHGDGLGPKDGGTLIVANIIGQMPWTLPAENG